MVPSSPIQDDSYPFPVGSRQSNLTNEHVLSDAKINGYFILYGTDPKIPMVDLFSGSVYAWFPMRRWRLLPHLKERLEVRVLYKLLKFVSSTGRALKITDVDLFSETLQAPALPTVRVPRPFFAPLREGPVSLSRKDDMKLKQRVIVLWHGWTHCHWTAERMEADGSLKLVVEMCVSRTWLPWLLNVDKISVAIFPVHTNQTIVGYLNLDQLDTLLQMEDVTEMRIFVMANGNGTLLTESF